MRMSDPWKDGSLSKGKEVCHWMYIAVFTRAVHWSVLWATWVQCTTSHHISVRYILVLSSHWYSGHRYALDVESCQWLSACLKWNYVELMADIYVMNIQILWYVLLYCDMRGSCCFNGWQCASSGAESPLKEQCELLTQWCSVSLNTWVFSNTSLWTSSLALFVMFILELFGMWK
jgi:hypothetical protein